MNKLLLSSDIIDLKDVNAEIIIWDNQKRIINAIDLKENLDLNIKILKNATLHLNIFDVTETKKININIEMFDKARLFLSLGFVTYGEYTANINVRLHGSDILSDVNVRGINTKTGKTTVVMDANVDKNTKNSKLYESAKILNNSDFSNVLIPALIVDSFEVEAFHGASIDRPNSDEIFYLESKGIEKSQAISLIENGFILSIMDDNIRKRVKNILMRR